MRAMGHHTILDNSEKKGALAGASTDMGSSFHTNPLNSAKQAQEMYRTSFPDSTVSSASRLRESIIHLNSPTGLDRPRATNDLSHAQLEWP